MMRQLDAEARMALKIAESPHIAHSNGRVITLKDPQTGKDQVILDDLPNLQALDRLLRIRDQRAKLLGTYAPNSTRIEVIPADVVEARVAENERMIAEAERSLGIGAAALPPASE
jgi:hypothetical protein